MKHIYLPVIQMKKYVHLRDQFHTTGTLMQMMGGSKRRHYYTLTTSSGLAPKPAFFDQLEYGEINHNHYM